MTSKKCVDRISIFRQLTVDEVSNLSMTKFPILLDPHYNSFVIFCDRIKNEEGIEKVSCFLDGDRLEFVAERTDIEPLIMKF